MRIDARVSLRAVTLLVAVAGCGTGCGDDAAPPVTTTDICTAAELTDALADARAGDVVQLGACRIAGSFRVSTGVTLRGVGLESVLVADGDRGVLSLEPASGDVPTRVASLAVEGSGHSAVSAIGPGSVELADLTVGTVRGGGIGIRDVTGLSVQRVTVRGPVTRDNVEMLPAVVLFEEQPTHGVVLVNVTSAELDMLNVSGFADTAVHAAGGAIRWAGGGIRESRGIGLYASGGSVDLDGVEICRMMRVDGAGALESMAVVLRDGVVATTRGLAVCDNDRYGIVQEGSSASHTDLRASGNGTVAVWSQHGASLVVEGASVFEENVEAAIVAFESPGVRIADAAFRNTRMGSRPNPDQLGGDIDLGDGVQLVRSVSGSVLSDLTFERNARVGLFLSSETRTIDVTISGVSVDGVDAQLGAIADDGMRVHTPGSGWDEGVVRLGATLTNDSEQADPLDPAGIIGPCMVPPVDIHAVDEATR